MRRPRRLGATLIELVAVTGLITAMVAGSNYRQALNRAREQAVANNLKQAWMLFTMEGRLPEATFYPEDPGADRDSIIKLMPELKPLLVCDYHPEKMREKGLSFVFNDELAGKPLGRIPDKGKTWVLLEATIMDPGMRKARGARFMALYADGSAKAIGALPPDLAEKVEKMEKQEKDKGG